MLIWGWKTYLTRLAVLFAVCAFCRHEGAQVLDKRQTKFTLFFIPLFPTSTKFLQQCTLCAAQSQLTKEAADAAVAQAGSGVPRGGVTAGGGQPAGGSRGQDALVQLAVGQHELRDGSVRQLQVESGVRCNACGGSGGSGTTPCATCSGQGRMRAIRTISAPVPAGLSYSMRVKLEGEGEVGPRGGPAADVYVELVAPVSSSPR